MSQLENFSKWDLDTYVVFVDTTVILPDVIDFVKEVSERFDWNLKILRPEVDFWKMVERCGFPQKNKRWCCYHLKIKPIREFIKKLKPRRCEVLGLRRDESHRRRNIMPYIYDWRDRAYKYCPIVFWSEKDVLKYMRKHNLPIPPHYSKGFKETCFCGTFTTVSEVLALRANYPEFFQKFIEIEGKMKSGGSAFYIGGKRIYAREIKKQTILDKYIKKQ